MKRWRWVLLALSALLLTGLAVAISGLLAGAINVPLLFIAYRGRSLRFAYLALPAATYPLLVAKCPLTSPRQKWAIALALLALLASAAYMLTSPRNAISTGSIVILGVVTISLAVLTSASLRHARDLSLAFHGILVAWFFGCGFPYSGPLP